ncbi:hypothetical protein MKX03_031880 [Papaver bracteatum]|nr:hypothetical protein MKX03_031880 [Papaver bracteatum]
MSAVSIANQDDNQYHQLKNTLMEFANYTVSSQDTMFGKIERSLQTSSAGIETLLRKVVDSQAQNQLQQARNQQEMMEMLRILANNTSTSTGISISSDVVVRNEASGSNQQQEDRQKILSGHEGYEPLHQALRLEDWKKAMEYLSEDANQTTIKKNFETRNPRGDIFRILYRLLFHDQMMLLEEFLKVVPSKALEFHTPDYKCTTILHSVAVYGNLRGVKALVKKNRNLTGMRDKKGDTPLLSVVRRVTSEQKEVMEYLRSVTRDDDPSPSSGQEGALLSKCLIEDSKDDIREEVDKVVENKVSESNQQQGTAYSPLFHALRLEDWKRAEEYLSEDANQTTLKEIFETRDPREDIFHILYRLLSRHQVMLLEEFLKLVPSKALEYNSPEHDGATILHSAVGEGSLRAVKALVKKNRNLTQIRCNKDVLYVPLLTAVNSATDGQKEVLEYLCSVTRDDDPSPFSGNEGVLLMRALIQANMYGVALSICQRFPESLKQWVNIHAQLCTIISVLQLLIERPFAFHSSGTKLSWWQRRIYSVLEEDSENEHYRCMDINKRTVESSEGIKGDEENPLENSTKEKFSSSTSNKRTISKCISFYLTRCIRRVPCINKLYHQKLMHRQAVALVKCFLELLRDANDRGAIKHIFLKEDTLRMAINFRTTEFVLECFRLFPFLSVDVTLLRLAVRERNELIYDFMCIRRRQEQYDGFSTRDDDWNSILHVSAEVAHNRLLSIVSGAAFQMQREIQWFKGVENTILQKDRFLRNKKDESAQFLFTEKHKDLMEKAEKWMKELSTSCMVVAALIATIAFAAAITVPGGNISDNDSGENGLPIFLHNKSFMIFAIPNALALFSSVTSVLMFLTVFTSRYSEEDFIKSLPQKIIIGLFTLFISMATMLVAFGAVFTIVVGRGSVWAPIIVSLLGCAPLLLFGFMQFPLFFEMVRSTYWPIAFGNEDNPLLKPYLPKEKKD